MLEFHRMRMLERSDENHGIEGCCVRMAGVQVKGCFISWREGRGMKTMNVATDRLWGRIWQVGGSGKGE
jgi:hypothetical protein